MELGCPIIVLSYSHVLGCIKKKAPLFGALQVRSYLLFCGERKALFRYFLIAYKVVEFDQFIQNTVWEYFNHSIRDRLVDSMVMRTEH